ncbi:putative ABC transport system permease protein [Altererythrobacter atlanticus]|uniref:Macrolide export ATP-binding/permease protein MacB n=1 Tax=Croceibacterium atlanticum TaxID=1267766 RepID=A0A0F7KTP6_9SPHN|nr:ABC transporter permease [Croceibacterium atlanticum]AKH42617.1 Macrolide export ATP-binding/permease protein MacB [Croceibacterium atlanticum]MBB5731394.1 putative ABC transport system permease protein [Croceibacterium atlanticum]
MNNLRHQIDLAFQGLIRNRVQAGLAMIGMMVGVAALVTSLALGRGAQDALEEQLRAAGANLLLVTAGNYQVRTGPLNTGDATSHGFGWLDDPAPLPGFIPQPGQKIRPGFAEGEMQPASFDGELAPLPMPFWDDEVPAMTPAVLYQEEVSSLFTRIHFENDPMEVHNHPVAAERLGDSAAGLGAAATLTREDAEEIRKIPGVQFVVSGVHENERLKVEGSDAEWFTRMHGTEARLPEVRTGWTMVHGRFLDQDDIAEAEQVAVLGRVVSDKLFGEDANPVGETVVLWNQPFRVIGVVSSKSWAASPTPGDDQFDAFYVPISTIHKLLNLSQLNSIAVTTDSVGDTTEVAEKITELLRERHGITEEMADDFKVESVAQQVLGKGLAPSVARVVSGNMATVDEMTVANLSSSLKRTNRTIVALLAGVATVSLLVGGIGVMNLLLLSVTQRTREVGLRMAVGARPKDIAAQFLFEAVLLSLIGGIAGIILGVAASGSLEQFFHWSAVISPVAAILAVLVAILLGAIFGVYPARRAARLSPIEALRYE